MNALPQLRFRLWLFHEYAECPTLKNVTYRTPSAHRGLSALVAVGGALAVTPASALELGDITVQSRLGQPLRASIAYALAPNEQVAKSCISLRSGSSVSGLPGTDGAVLSVSNGVIMLAGSSAVREPMVSAHVVINCPYAPNLSREYMLLIDPATPAYENVVTTQQTLIESEPVVVTPAVTRPASKPAVYKDIGPSTKHRVQPGESLSEIASRIRDRGIGLWPAVNAIFEANPHAFMNSDPNQLKAGSLLSIPSFNGKAPVITATVADPVATTATEVPVVAPAEMPIYETPADTVAAESPAVNAATPIEIGDTTADLKPGDIVLDDNPFVEPISGTETVDIADTRLEGPATSSSSPNVPTAIIRTNNSRGTGAATPSWILWLAGSGVALFAGLLMFGRRFRGDTDTTPFEPAIEETQNRRFTDRVSDTENLRAVDVDFDLSDDSPTEENLVLDADVIIGTGLDASKESNLTEDFGFAATTELDIELPFEPEASVQDSTDILPPMHSDDQVILTSEILPDDDEYDMSVIVDATKMPQPEDVTERDLQAVVVEADDETQMSDAYTINKDADYDVLEQDYEDELTATQALNDEITRAAAELAARMDVEVIDNDETTAMPLASVTELDITAQMPAQNDDVSDLDDTGITQEITINEAADDSTVEMPAEKKTAR
ncbi:MAG TPA: hypothetical protein PKH39_07290 [Woeseiaceae bacterium]|nr:hypothetical protein [Woeseiaceae bacterium]